MTNNILRKVAKTDVEYFARWWRDEELIKLTSGVLEPISDKDVDKFFQSILDSEVDYHFMIVIDNKTIGHISLSKRKCSWFEIQIVIGEKDYWGRGYGANAINAAINVAREQNISKIFLEVRPTNLRAIKSYEKCGFKSVGITTHRNNKYLPETVRMELLLG